MKTMKAEYPDGDVITPAEEQQLQQLRTTITRILSDGYVSRQEHDELLRVIYADGKVSREESRLFRLVQEKIWQGEVYIGS